MAVLVDPPLWPAHGTLWSHLVSDHSLAELHTFAADAGLPARSFDLDHYDVPASRHAELRDRGALAVDAGTLVRRLRASGLRRTERERIGQVEDLRAAWAALAPGGLGGPTADAWTAVGEDLLARWGEKGRLHHGRTHLREVLDSVDLLAADGVTPEQSRRAWLAAWFHDAVHSSGRRHDGPLPRGVTDEQASADLARHALTGRVATEVRDDVVRLVLLTATHRPEAGDAVGALLCDADLAVLGQSPARYADYAAAIRVEYAHVPTDVFRPARAAVLEQLLGGPLFHTTAGRRRWEDQARTNLSAEITALRA
ncbi:DUF4031 domain-containing protein [Serinibacter arcticus]|uniref:DUF4031 domain-containing protein n=1 Tax=Serinibacter arcticus TaxID=1655435 RepID=A0A4Z1E4E2_9MICO|nr:DUF4031 domain-containing protein [Serinibacter arcticus]TGO05778.1 hypothetical protein SERN_1782 [Serinibacter arcticus]